MGIWDGRFDNRLLVALIYEHLSPDDRLPSGSLFVFRNTPDEKASKAPPERMNGPRIGLKTDYDAVKILEHKAVA